MKEIDLNAMEKIHLAATWKGFTAGFLVGIGIGLVLTGIVVLITIAAAVYL